MDFRNSTVFGIVWHFRNFTNELIGAHASFVPDSNHDSVVHQGKEHRELELGLVERFVSVILHLGYQSKIGTPN